MLVSKGHRIVSSVLLMVTLFPEPVLLVTFNEDDKLLFLLRSLSSI
jgi:hypothetical protein